MNVNIARRKNRDTISNVIIVFISQDSSRISFFTLTRVDFTAYFDTCTINI